MISCSRKSETQNILDHAEAAMEECPDSALMLLQGIDSSSLNGGEESARYALLFSMAKYKNYLPFTNDSLISTACDYYSSNGSEKEEMMSMFYRAAINLETGNTNDATVYALTAADLASSLNDSLMIARTNEILADIFSLSFNHDFSLHHREKASQYYKEIGKWKNHFYAEVDRAATMHALGEFSVSADIIDSLFNIYRSSESADSAMFESLLSKAIPIYNDLGAYDKAQRAMAQRLDMSDSFPISMRNYLDMSTLMLSVNNHQKARELINSGLSQSKTHRDSLTMLYPTMWLLKREHNYEEAFITQETILKQLTEEVRTILNNSAMKTRGDFFASFSEKVTKKLSKEKQAKMLLALLVFCAITLSLVIIIFIKKRNKKRIALEVEKYALLTSDLDMISEENNKLKDNVSRLDNILFTHIRTVNSLCVQYERDDTTNLKIINQRINSELDELRDKKNLNAIISIVNFYTDGVLDRIKENFPKIKDDDLLFIALYIAGFNSRIIAIVSGLSVPGVYSKKLRLSKRFEENGFPDIWSISLQTSKK